MPFDESLATKIDQLTNGKKGFVRKQMFGGIAYLYHGNMCVGVYKDDLIVRYDPKLAAEITADPHVKPFDISGKPMKGWSLVTPAGVRGDELLKWFELALNFAKSLPVKN